MPCCTGTSSARLVLVIRVLTRGRMGLTPRRGSVASRSTGCPARGPMYGSGAGRPRAGSPEAQRPNPPRGSRSAIAGHRKRRHATFDQRFRQLLPWVACRLVEAFDRVRLREPAMTYSSWGNACGPCSTRSCRCLQCRLRRSSGARRERASSCQSDNDPDFPDPRTRRVDEVGFAERLSLGGLHTEVLPIYPGRKTSEPDGRRSNCSRGSPRSVHADAKCGADR